VIPAPVNIAFVRGDSYSKFGRVRTKVWDATAQAYIPGPYRDITGWTGLAQVRATVDTATVLFEFTVTVGNQETVPGSFFLTAAPAVTAALTTLAGVWDLQWTTDTGEVYTYAAGTVTLTKDVSRV
jgi:hypothetical protein